jgi:hypothetical protein
VPVGVLAVVPVGLALLSYLVHRARRPVPRPRQPMEVSSR